MNGTTHRAMTPPAGILWTLYRASRTASPHQWDEPSGPHVIIGGSHYIEGHHLGEGLWCAWWAEDTAEGLPLDVLRERIGPWTIVRAEVKP